MSCRRGGAEQEGGKLCVVLCYICHFSRVQASGLPTTATLLIFEEKKSNPETLHKDPPEKIRNAKAVVQFGIERESVTLYVNILIL